MILAFDLVLIAGIVGRVYVGECKRTDPMRLNDGRTICPRVMMHVFVERHDSAGLQKFAGKIQRLIIAVRSSTTRPAS